MPANILLVDDEPAVRRIFARMLEQLGYGVLEAGSAGEALVFVEHARPAPVALITDIRMPTVPGTRLAWMVREYLPGLPVLFVSGFEAEEPFPGNLPPRSAFLRKPYTIDQLGAVLRALLGHPPIQGPA